MAGAPLKGIQLRVTNGDFEYRIRLKTMVGEHMQDVLGEPLQNRPDEPARELTVDEAIELAIQLQQQDDLDAAEIVYREIRRVDPDNPRAMHFSGVLAHQLGRSSDGASR